MKLGIYGDMEDKTTPFNGLSPAEAERLAKLAEECGEVVQIVGKVLVHGWESCHPDDLLKRTNRELLLKEIGDISAVVGLMLVAKDLPHPPTNEQIDKKTAALHRYCHHQS